jgi:hypothetical protein
MSNQSIAEAIFDKLYEDFNVVTPTSPIDNEIGMLFKLFRFEKVRKIKAVLEKCSQ